MGVGRRVLVEAALNGNGQAPLGDLLRRDCLSDARKHSSEPDPEQGIAAVVQHVSECQRLHLLLPNSFVCRISERDLPFWTPDFLQNPMNATLASPQTPDCCCLATKHANSHNFVPITLLHAECMPGWTFSVYPSP